MRTFSSDLKGKLFMSLSLSVCKHLHGNKFELFDPKPVRPKTVKSELISTKPVKRFTF